MQSTIVSTDRKFEVQILRQDMLHIQDTKPQRLEALILCRALQKIHVKAT